MPQRQGDGVDDCRYSKVKGDPEEDGHGVHCWNVDFQLAGAGGSDAVVKWALRQIKNQRQAAAKRNRAPTSTTVSAITRANGTGNLR